MTAPRAHSQTFVALLRDRNKALRKRLSSAGIDALLVSSKRDIRYLTGFVGDDSLALVPIGGKGKKPWIVSDFRFEEQIPREAPDAKMVIREKTLVDAIGKIARQQGWETIGLQQEHVTLAQHKRLKKEFKARQLHALDDGLLVQRAVKSREEVRHILHALDYQQQAFKEMLEFIQPGMTESQVAAYLDYRMRALGASGTSFSTIVAAGANASLPHAIPSSTKLARGKVLLVDWGAKSCGYCSDMTRTLFLGEPEPKMAEVYKIVLEAQLAGIAAIKPGAELKDVDAAARKVIEDAGYGEQFGHSLGHGIGLDIHEQPTLAQRSKGVLQPGNVVTVEPGIYLPGVGGVRIEDDVLVTERGGRVLSSLPKSLDDMIVA